MTGATATLAGAAGGLAASPLLAAWTAGLAARQRDWWRPRRVSWWRWAMVAVLASVLCAAAVHARPVAGWLLLAAGGTVLAVVDVHTYRLPSALLYPLAGAIAMVVVAAAAIDSEPGRLGRAALAAALVTGVWLAAGLAAPDAVGLADVWLCGLTAGLLGWSGWLPVWLGQAGAWLLAVPLAAAIAAARRQHLSARMPVPAGAAIVAGAIAAACL